MDDNPYRAPREPGARRPRWTLRTRLQKALFLIVEGASGLALSVMLLYSVSWKYNAILLALILLGWVAEWMAPPPKLVEDPEAIPYDLPDGVPQPKVPYWQHWHPLARGSLGFVFGTMLVSPLVPSDNRVYRAIIGAVCGGIPIGLYLLRPVIRGTTGRQPDNRGGVPQDSR